MADAIENNVVQFLAPEKKENVSPSILVIKFADSKIPVFKEKRGKDYIEYGEKNHYPEYLTWLYDKSAKHNAFINGKARYIFGEGFENGNSIVNRCGETLNDISEKALLDVEIYGGFRLEVLYNSFKKVSEIYHVDYSTLRIAKEGGGYYYKEAWNTKNSYGEWCENTKEAAEYIPEFNPKKPFGTQIYAYNEYRPMSRYYPLPNYIGSNNWIETDIEISIYNLSAIRNGMMPSKMVQFFTGEPGEDAKREIERRFNNKFSGAGNAGKIIFVFNQANATKPVQVDDLSQTELDKLFDQLNKTCQQEILSGHQITSPMLFGIKTEGQLGGATELNISYSIFQNTYAKPKAKAYDREMNYLMSFSMFPGVYELKPTDPVGIQFDVKDVVNSLPKEFVFDHLGIPKELWDKPNIGEDNRATQTIPIAPPAQVNSSRDLSMSNAILQNLSGRQHQQVMRILYQYDKGKMNQERAKTFLRSGYGFSDEEINTLLGVMPAQMSAQDEEDFIVGMFDGCGDNKSDFQILRSKAVTFDNEIEAEFDEEIFKSSFKDALTVSEERIIELIRKDKLITPEVIAGLIGQSKGYVESKIATLVQKGYIEEQVISNIGDDAIERIISPEVNIPIPPTLDKLPITEISIKYSYEVKPNVGPPIIKTTRPFCIKMLGLNRIYSRAEIEQISQRLGYSVFDRKGGWWGHNPECRHRWVSHIVVTKKGGDK